MTTSKITTHNRGNKVFYSFNILVPGQKIMRSAGMFATKKRAGLMAKKAINDLKLENETITFNEWNIVRKALDLKLN